MPAGEQAAASVLVSKSHRERRKERGSASGREGRKRGAILLMLEKGGGEGWLLSVGRDGKSGEAWREGKITTFEMNNFHKIKFYLSLQT